MDFTVSDHTDWPPDWMGGDLRNYLEHVAMGRSLRTIARDQGCHPSTVMRQVRRLEARRDDPLLDSALDRIEADLPVISATTPERNGPDMASDPKTTAEVDTGMSHPQARRILRRLCETGSFLAMSPKLKNAMVMRATGPDDMVRTAVLAREVAEALALRDWIRLIGRGTVCRYEITEAGRAALKRMLAADAGAAASDGFAEQHRAWGERVVAETGPAGITQTRRLRTNLGESPVTMLARKKDADGKAFLGPAMLAAAERLREDFELAQMGPRTTQNWDRFLTTGRTPGGFGSTEAAEGPAAARDRVSAAVRDLGPGLADIVLRCCCFLEGLEAAERRLGWSARSGKIVLRIGLQRLERHYAARDDGTGRTIG